MPPAQLERLMPELLHTGNPYAFVVAVSALPARMSWLSELGMESFRQVMGGNVRAGREIFRHLMGLMEASPVALSSRRHPEFESVLGELFNRFVEYMETAGFEEHSLRY